MTRSTWRVGVMGVAALALAGCEPTSAPLATEPPAVAESPAPAAVTLKIDIEVTEPTSDAPFAAAAGITPAQVRPGETVTLVIRAKTADQWHIYTVDKPAGVSIQTTLDLNLPDGVAAAGEWSNPVAEPYKAEEPVFIYHGDFLFHRQLQIADDAAPGTLEVKCEFGYQACNDSLCLPPTSTELTAELEIVAN